ncbi:hypothetical protein SDC9_72477 [bioreactor metagenome]|uniref:Uncharacterized protein n=1 Tax=bioreactor metagenome TaxID=1076179 RepID=A0A644YBP5_9ZZZZ
MSHPVGEVEHLDGQRGQGDVEPPEDLGEPGHDHGDQDVQDEDGEEDDHRGVGDGGDDFPPQFVLALQEGGQAVEGFVQLAAFFSGGDDGDHEGVELRPGAKGAAEGESSVHGHLDAPD